MENHFVFGGFLAGADTVFFGIVATGGTRGGVWGLLESDAEEVPFLFLFLSNRYWGGGREGGLGVRVSRGKSSQSSVWGADAHTPPNGLYLRRAQPGGSKAAGDVAAAAVAALGPCVS